MSDIAAPVRISTGIPSLDDLIEGGLLSGGVYVVEGPPGAGKTILGSQLCFRHAAEGGRALYVTLLAESHTRQLAHLRRMSFFDPTLVPERVYYLSGFKVLESEGLDGLLRVLRQTISSRQASVLVLDSLISAEEASTTTNVFKKFLHELTTVAAMTGCTVVLLNSTERVSSFRPELTMVDGIIELSDELVQLRPLRRLRIRKMRGTDQVRGQHTVEIDDDGLRVVRRIETVRPPPRLPDALLVERLPVGIAGLDEMLRGGLPGRSMTALLGPSGSGKTLLGLHFLKTGTERGEPGVHFGFYETPSSLVEKSKRLGLDLTAAHAAGKLEIVWQPPVESIIDVLADRLISAVQRIQARRLFLDGLQGFQLAATSTDRVRRVFAALRQEFEALGVTTLFTQEVSNLLGWDVDLSIEGVSAITENLLLLRHVELSSRLCRLISVAKLRDSEHDDAVRQFSITSRGIEVMGVLEGPQGTTPEHRVKQRATSTRPSKPKPRSKAGKAKKKAPRRRISPAKHRP